MIITTARRDTYERAPFQLPHIYKHLFRWLTIQVMDWYGYSCCFQSCFVICWSGGFNFSWIWWKQEGGYMWSLSGISVKKYFPWMLYCLLTNNSLWSFALCSSVSLHLGPALLSTNTPFFPRDSWASSLKSHIFLKNFHSNVKSFPISASSSWKSFNEIHSSFVKPHHTDTHPIWWKITSHQASESSWGFFD